MKQKILNDRKVDPFSIIRQLPQMPLFEDCPVKPSDETIDAAEELYLKFGEAPHYVSSYDEKIIFEWYHPNRKNPKMLRELVFNDSKNLEWRVYDY